MTNENGRKTKRLSREILGLLLITAVIALFFWGFLYLTANSISETYFAERNLQPSEGQWVTLRAWIRSVSLLSTVILFLVLFLFLLGQKLAYLREIIQGVDALRTHRLEDTIPLREANELTELAEHINFLSETERRLRQQEMALQAERERMIRDLSHDIRTPLNGIRGVTAIAEYYADDMEKQAECRHKVMQASGFLMELVNNVLNMNKLESGEMKPENKPFDLIELLTETASIVEMQGQEYAIHFQMQMGKHKYRHLIGSPLYLKQVLQNIGGNAVKYNRAGGAVTFASEDVAYSDGRAVIKFTCTDTGRGMSREFLVHAFEPFSQENTDARTTFTGTGLGLAITKQMVELMEGTISLKSEQNVGTTISVTIPFRIDVDYTEPQEDAKPADAASLEGVHVLLVEDNELNMEISQYILEGAGAIVAQAWNGQEAVRRFSESEPGTFDCILMDVMMPLMDGLEATRTIRAMQRPDAATIPIVAMTANTFSEDEQRSREAGMNLFLNKPVDSGKMLQTVLECLKMGGENAL